MEIIGSKEVIALAVSAYESARIPGHPQQIFATMAMWARVDKRLKENPEVIEHNRDRIKRTIANLELKLQNKNQPID